MNLYGIHNTAANAAAIRPTQTPPQRPLEQEQPAPAQTRAPAPAATPPARGVAPATETGQSVPVEPPAGTDPELWNVLTRDERAFFAKAGGMGPLTYGYLLNANRTDAPVSRGARLDVKA